MENAVASAVVLSSPSEVSPLPQLASNAECFRHKNHLQEYTQKYAISMPLYQTINEGSSHAPRFSSTVTVDGKTFSSPKTFSLRKSAEQEVARVALESLSTSIPQGASVLFNLDASLCKSVLNEYASKMRLPFPSYSNSQKDGIIPTFSSTIVFNEKTCTGPYGKSKKEAEQLAARTVIESILGESHAAVMVRTIKAKEKLFESTKVEGTCDPQAITFASDSDMHQCHYNPLQLANWPPLTGLSDEFPVAVSKLFNELVPTFDPYYAVQHSNDATPARRIAILSCKMQGTDYETVTQKKRKKMKKRQTPNKKLQVNVQSEPVPAK